VHVEKEEWGEGMAWVKISSMKTGRVKALLTAKISFFMFHF
jgi:hypothetical protein